MVRVFVFLAVLAVLGLLTGCSATIGNPAATLPAPTATPQQTPSCTLINDVVSLDNGYRLATNQPVLQSGLSCNLYSVPSNTLSIQTASLGSYETFVNTLPFNQPNCLGCLFNVLPAPLQPIYNNYFVLKCTGYIASNGSNFHNFTLASDDGSILTIDGQTVINNDGRHGVVTVTNGVYLNIGLHAFELDYYQYNGPFALMLSMDGNIMPATGFYH